jgi:hypothetical protein
VVASVKNDDRSRRPKRCTERLKRRLPADAIYAHTGSD